MALELIVGLPRWNFANLQNNRGNTALHFAYENNHKKIIKVGNGLVLLWIACVLHFLSLYNISADPFLLTLPFFTLVFLLPFAVASWRWSCGTEKRDWYTTQGIAEKVRPAKLCYSARLGGSIWKGGLNSEWPCSWGSGRVLADLQPIWTRKLEMYVIVNFCTGHPSPSSKDL